MDAGVDDMPTHRRETRSVKDLTAYWKEASRMSNAEHGQASIGRRGLRSPPHGTMSFQLAGMRAGTPTCDPEAMMLAA